MEGPTKPDNRGKGVGTIREIESLEACIELCKANERCESFLYHSKNKVCTLKDLVLTGSEEIESKNAIFFSVYKTCKEGNYLISVLLFCR